MNRAAILAIAGCCPASIALAPIAQAFEIQDRTDPAPAAEAAAPAAHNEETVAPLSPAEEAVTPAAPASDPYPVEALGEPRVTDRYASSRFGEDWRSMRQADRRDDPLDRLKYLPIAADGDIYLTVSGEARVRFDHGTEVSHSR